MLTPKSVLITGSSQGIGLEFVKAFLKLTSPPKHIFASCINKEQAGDLDEIAKTNPCVKVIELDVEKQDSVEKARDVVQSTVQDEGLNLLVNNAGILKRMGFHDVTREDMRKHYEVNCIGPLMMAKTFYPLLKQAASRCPGEPMSCSKAAIINVGSGQGSITENASSGMYPYRASKCALNMMMTCWSIDLKADGILCASIAPGWVRTSMGGQNAAVTTEESLKAMFETMEKLGDEDTGKFLHATRGGTVVPW
ncbi:C-signal-like [Ruditapes philippinarum]|uniref:C-signal-like n=1 Tax=Ruditapes philippinarum TaxID=129788 RepID=UPI00295AA01F|nr:C-signal-like [Ruditapes philippinarum]